jgi:hypothetical protein
MVEANALQLTELKKMKEDISRLEREGLYCKIQIEALYSKIEDLEKD